MSRRRKTVIWTLILGMGLVFLLGLSGTSFAAWVDVDGTGQTDIRIYDNATTSWYPLLYLDSNNYPHIAWDDDADGDNDIFYLKWNGSSWVDADGSGTESIRIYDNATTSWYPSLYLDSNNYPHIAWEDNADGDYDIFYLKWNGSSWVDADGSGTESIRIYNNATTSRYPSLYLDSNNDPHIAWDNDTTDLDYDIFYLKWNGVDAWVDADGTGQTDIKIYDNATDSEYPSLYLDSSGYPHIAWEDKEDGDYDIFYLKWNGSSWVDADGSGTESIRIYDNATTSWYPSLYLDSNNDPHIAWYDDADGDNDIFYLKWNGSIWVDADGSGTESIRIYDNATTSRYPSLYLDSNGYPHIAWQDNADGDNDIFYLKWNGSSWVDADGSGTESIRIYDNAPGSWYPSLYLDSSGYPHIAWEDSADGDYDIFYLKWSVAAGAGIDHHRSWYECAIATASYGTPIAEEIKVLSTFRDEYLLTNKTGQALVKLYYRHSPQVADFIRDKEPLKAVVRAGLRPLVCLAKKLIN